MAKIRTLKRKLSIILKIEVREIKKYKQRGGFNQKLSYEEQISFSADRLTNLVMYKRINNKLKSIQIKKKFRKIHQKLT